MPQADFDYVPEKISSVYKEKVNNWEFHELCLFLQINITLQYNQINPAASKIHHGQTKSLTVHSTSWQICLTELWLSTLQADATSNVWN